jgi:hypothetical protein
MLLAKAKLILANSALAKIVNYDYKVSVLYNGSLQSKFFIVQVSLRTNLWTFYDRKLQLLQD